MSLNNPGRERAARHAAQAQEYRRLADLLLARETAPEAAGELLYAAAKQGINAVANQQGVNPAATAAKRRFLAAIAESAPAAAALRDNWQSAADLHIHADRLHLPAADFTKAWEKAQLFIDQMLAIYDGGG